MRVFQLNPNAKNYTENSVVTIGNFDGVHLGHQAIIEHSLKIAKKKSLPLMVMIFEPQPKEYFDFTNSPSRLFGLREKLHALKQLGVDYVVCMHFDANFSMLLPREFFLNILVDALHAKHIVIGKDFYFGRGRLGSPEAMLEMAINQQLALDIYDFHCVDDQRVSSTLVRNLLAAGKLDEAEQMLGHPYYMIGRVGYGQRLGHQLGVPTANISISRYKSALHGIFCVKIKSCHSDALWLGVANIGKRPTINGQKKILEVHLFDFQGSLYGEFLQVSFLHKLRDEMKFDSLDALKHQIHTDIQSAKHFFEH